MKRINLTQGKVALVDDEDYERLTKQNWDYVANGYAQRGTFYKGQKSSVLMHREIMNPDKGVEIDHINGDKLDNRKCNLRLATRAQNGRNCRKKTSKTTSIYKGVHFDYERQVWRAGITVDGRWMHLGRFQDEQDAALAYNKAAKRYHGEYAKLNELKEIEKNGKQRFQQSAKESG